MSEWARPFPAADSTNIDEREIDYLLASLLEKSLAIRAPGEGGVRYRLLETVRDYGRARLLESAESDFLRTRHRDYYLQLCESVEPDLFIGDEAEAMRKFWADHENLRAGLLWCAERINRSDVQGQAHENAAALRFGTALGRFWIISGQVKEGLDYLKAVLSHDSKVSESIKAAAMNAAGNLAYISGDELTAKQLYEDCLTASRKSNDRPREAITLNNLALVAMHQGEHEKAKAYSEESVSIQREIGDHHRAAIGLGTQAHAAMEREDWQSAKAILEKCIAELRRFDNSWSLALNLLSLSRVLFHTGEFKAERECLLESIALSSGLSGWALTASALGRLAAAEMRGRRPMRAAQMMAGSSTLRERVSTPPSVGEREELESLRTQIQSEVGEEKLSAVESAMRALPSLQIVERAVAKRVT